MNNADLFYSETRNTRYSVTRRFRAKVTKFEINRSFEPSYDTDIWVWDMKTMSTASNSSLISSHYAEAFRADSSIQLNLVTQCIEEESEMNSNYEQDKLNNHERSKLRGGGGGKLVLGQVWERIRRRGSEEQSRNSVPPNEISAAPALDPGARNSQLPNVFSGLWSHAYSSPHRVPNEAQVPAALWWFAGGRAGSQSRPTDVHGLRTMRSESDKVDLPVKDWPRVHGETRPRSFVQEIGYTLSDGRYGSGRSEPRHRQKRRQERTANHNRQPAPALNCPRRSNSDGRVYDRLSVKGGEVLNAQTSSSSRVTSWAQSSDDHLPGSASPNTGNA